jgi:hypothetical protein
MTTRLNPSQKQVRSEGLAKMDLVDLDIGADAPPNEVPRLLQAPGHTWSGLLHLAEWAVVAFLLVTLVKGSFMQGWSSLRNEFPDYYLAAALPHHGIPLDRVYEWPWFQRQNDRLGVSDGLVSFAPNPPSSVLPLVPLAALRPLAAKRVWLILNLAFLGVTLWLLSRVTSLGWRRLVLLSLLCVVPLRFTFMFGRYYVLILLLLTAAYYASRHGAEWTSGMLLSAAAVLKLFPALFVILIVWKRNWRALAGFLVGAAVFVGISLFVFGVEVHRVFVLEILSQVSRGDWLGPYYLSRNTFITLWSHLFLIEPELNPFPFIDSPLLYALMQAITTTMLLFCFLLSVDRNDRRQSTALQWAAAIPLLLLLSTTTGIDHPCVLIFTAIVGVDVLLAMDEKHKAFMVLLLYVASCAPIPSWISQWILIRLVAITGLCMLLLYVARSRRRVQFGQRWLAAFLVCLAGLTTVNLYAVQSRSEDFSRRLPGPANGYRAGNPVPIPGGVAFTEMRLRGYGAVLLRDGEFRELRMPGDVLAIAGSPASPVLYAELSGSHSFIVRVPTDRLASVPEIVAAGQEPALSPNGKWLAFIREGQGGNTVWLLPTDSAADPQMLLSAPYHPIDVSVTSEGDVIASVGEPSDPYLVLVRRLTQEATLLPGFPQPARYPSISPDGERVAFSRREHGSWHLVVRKLTNGVERQLTHGSCNAISPSWQDAQTLLYATDCGRGVELSALASVSVPQ